MSLFVRNCRKLNIVYVRNNSWKIGKNIFDNIKKLEDEISKEDLKEVVDVAKNVENKLTELDDSTNGVLKKVGDDFVPGFKITRKVASGALNIAESYLDEDEK